MLKISAEATPGGSRRGPGKAGWGKWDEDVVLGALPGRLPDVGRRLRGTAAGAGRLRDRGL